MTRPTRLWLACVWLVASGMAGAGQAPISGLVVEAVPAGSVGARSAIVAGDVLLAYDGRPLPSPAALAAAEENLFVPAVVMTVRRGPDTLSLTAPGGSLGLRVRPSLPPPALAAYDEGRAAELQQHLDRAVDRWTVAARKAEEAGDAAASAWLHGLVGGQHDRQRRWKEAAAAYEAAWTLLQDGDDVAARSQVLTAQARCAQSSNDLPRAQELFERAAAVDESAGHERWMASNLNARGGVAYIRGHLPVAEESFERALSIRQRLVPDSLEVAGSLSNVANIAYRRGELAAAMAGVKQALAIQERLAPESLVTATMLSNIGNIANESGDDDTALEFHGRALALRERLAPESMDVAASLNNLGNVSAITGDYEAAREYHTRAIGIKQRLAPDSMSMAASLNNLGNVARALGDVDAALDHQTRALRIRQAIAPDAIEVATSLNNLGNLSRDRGDLTAAADFHRRALAIRERIAPDSLEVAVSLNNLGDLARAGNDLAEARRLYGRSLDIKERRAPQSLNVAVTLHALGLTASASGDLVAAREYHSRALALRERLAPASLAAAGSLSALGELAFQERQFGDARTLLTRAVAIVEEQRWQIRYPESRALLMQQYAESYTGLIDAHTALGDTPGAFALAETLRARSLLDILAENAAGIRPMADASLLARERHLQQEINKATSRQQRVLGRPHTDAAAEEARAALDAVLVRYREIQTEIRAADHRYGSLTQPTTLDLAAVQRDLLDDATVLLEYVLGDERSHLFAITRESSRVVALPARAQVEGAARRVYELLTARHAGTDEAPAARRARLAEADAAYPAAAAALSRMVLEPVSDWLRGRRLLIVADGALQYVPFAALPDPSAPAAAPGAKPSWQPLMIDHEVVNLPSASVLALLREQSRGRPPSGRLLAVVADPVFDAGDPRLQRAAAGRDRPNEPMPAKMARTMRAVGVADDRGAIARLPFTRQEAREILALVPERQSTAILDFDASRNTVMSGGLGRHRVIHLATHGVVDTERPELSGLVLSMVDADGRRQDGYLRLHEIYGLEWPAELVVLSGCQTGLGKDIRAEGLVGLTRGFMYAGAQRVMASLWNVNDSVTAQLMKRFYEGLFVRKVSPAAALRAAQTEMWRQRQWEAPYYWAAFVMQGEWR